MPNVSLAAGFRVAAMFSLTLIAGAPAWGQTYTGSPYDGNRATGYSYRGLRELEEWALVERPRDRVPSGPATVSADVLRHPISSNARRRLEKAMRLSDLGKHLAAIQELHETLVKEPSSAPYAQNILGLEYVENRQYAEAQSSFEEAVRLMPHESVNHSNLGYSLAIGGDFKSAEKEARKAIQLDPTNTKATSLLDTLLHIQRSLGQRP